MLLGDGDRSDSGGVGSAACVSSKGVELVDEGGVGSGMDEKEEVV